MSDKSFKLVYFALLLLVSFSIFYYHRSIYDVSSFKGLFKLENEIDTLIIGDSHPMSALDPNLIKNSKNIAIDSENYFFTYYKLKQYLSCSSHIRKVILGFSTHNVSKMSSEMFIYHEPTEKQVLERYYSLLDLEGKIRIMSLRTYFIRSVLKYDIGIPMEIYKSDLLIKKLFRKHTNEADYKFVGGFYRSEKSNVNIEDIHKKIKEYYYDDRMLYAGDSKFNIEYLYRIIDMCSKKNIKVYLYSSPVFSTYKELIPRQNLADFENVKNDIVKRHGNIEFIDHTDYIHERNYFGDQDHLNSLGAILVSKLISEKIQKEN